jgi:hypothetical protein
VPDDFITEQDTLSARNLFTDFLGFLLLGRQVALPFYSAVCTTVAEKALISVDALDSNVLPFILSSTTGILAPMVMFR